MEEREVVDDQKLQQPLAQRLINNSNYILVVALILINVVINVMEIEDGKIQLNSFKEYIWLDWVFWGIITFVPPVITVVMRTVLQKEGISKSKSTYPELIDEHYSYIKNDSSKKVRSESEYLREEATKKSIKTLLITLIGSFLTGSLSYGWDTTSWLRLALNTLMALVVGFLAFTASYNYGITELKTWYILDIERLKSLDREAMIASGKYLPEVK